MEHYGELSGLNPEEEEKVEEIELDEQTSQERLNEKVEWHKKTRAHSETPTHRRKAA